MSRRYTIIWWGILITLITAAAIPLLRMERITETGAEDMAPILIIDAGHGGEDGGAVAADGTLESDINLAISLRLKELADFWGIDTVMTRSAPDIDYPADANSLSAKKKADQNARLDIIRAYPQAVLLSIHQNYYPAASPMGIQVFFGEAEGSASFASVLQDNLTSQLCPGNRRVAEPIDSGIYLMRNAPCRAVLVECGFLSNPDELQKLCTSDYQTSLAVVMLASYMQYTRGTPT